MSVAQFGMLGAGVGIVLFTAITVFALWVQRREHAAESTVTA